MEFTITLKYSRTNLAKSIWAPFNKNLLILLKNLKYLDKWRNIYVVYIIYIKIYNKYIKNKYLKVYKVLMCRYNTIPFRISAEFWGKEKSTSLNSQDLFFNKK